MMIAKGDRVKYVFSHKVYEVSMIRNHWILLKKENGLSQVLTGLNNIGISYRKVRNKDGPIDLTFY